MKKKKIIEVQNLVKKYRKSEFNAVDDISFYVEEGSFFSLLGPNGAGKTTTLSILNTTLKKTRGTVQIAGYDLDKDAAQIRKRIGVIFQNPSLDLNLTAEENIRLHVCLYGLYPFRPLYSLMSQEYKKKVTELAEILDISSDIFKSVKTFSGGMKRKLEIIRSLTHNPKVLFLDEPTTGLDPLSRKNLWKYLQEVRKQEKTTIFLTTHYLEEAEGSDHICVVNRGNIVARGTPSEIKKTLISEYLVVNAKNEDALEKELKSKKIPYTREDEGPFIIKTNGNSAQQIIKKIDTTLSVLDIHAPTLEEAYLEIISQEKPAQ